MSDMPPLGDTPPLPAPPPEPDPLVDGTASDGVQPTDRGHVAVPPGGGK
jgi:hypothetical protein